MSELTDTTYSREATIAAVRDYYGFLTKLYLKESQVIYPPSGGWPSITNADPSVLRPLGKSDEVLALLARLPYIRRPYNWNDDAEGAPGCYFADWQSLIAGLTTARATTEGLRITTEGVPFYELAPPDVVGLTHGSRENPIMVLDTKLGIIHWEDCPYSIKDAYSSTIFFYDPPSDDCELDEADDYETEDDEEGNNEDEDDKQRGDDEDGDDEDEDGDDEDGDDKVDDNKGGDDDNDLSTRDTRAHKMEVEWRRSATAWAISDFFEVLKDQFRKLEWIPISHHEVWNAEWSCGPEDDDMISLLRDIYTQHGWPNFAHYRKSDCLEAVQRAMKERYPSRADQRPEKSSD